MDAGVDGLDQIQLVLETLMEVIDSSGALLRQFMLDDKGVVCIWNFGLASNVYEDSIARGLESCFIARKQLKSMATTANLASQRGRSSAASSAHRRTAANTA